ncbi:ribonuclease Y [Mycoplasma putrefaciens]|uniref:ribonuclease Y n=1 Tax=Mycoplasma putrefaciens TaxID=2123 RepID=UPI003DA4B602
MDKWELYLIIFACSMIVAQLAQWGIIWYLIKSKSRKQLVENRKKEAKLERKKIVADGYKEINDARNLFNKEVEIEKKELEKIRDKLELQALDVEQAKKTNQAKAQRIEARLLDLDKRRVQLDAKEDEIITGLENISKISQDQAKEILIKKMRDRCQVELGTILKNAEIEAHAKSKAIATQIMITAMERLKVDVVNQRTSNIVKLPNDDMKGRIIGKDGRNMKTFEQVGGVDIVIDETPNVITVSSFNPIRREIATRALENLISDGRIQPVKIEQELKKQKAEVDEIINESGIKTIEELKINDLDFELVKLIGKLRFRTSYGQNVLAHSIEVAKISGMIASELGLDATKAIRAGLLHDIGKALDFENQGSHVNLGAEIAKKYGEDEIIINAIESHHEDVEKTNEISAIVAIADTISASRPGARNNAIGEFVLRMHEIEKIGNQIPGVAKTYALQSGRQIRLIVDPVVVSDLELSLVLQQMTDAIKKQVVVPGEITITVIREKKEIQVLK